MCFGSETTQTNTNTPNAAVTAAANTNLNAASNLVANPNNTYGTQYGGQLIAGINPAQQATINAGQAIANNGTGTEASNLINSYASAPASSVSANSIASNMSPYMNQYVMQALAPQLQQMQIQNAAQNQATDAQATASGAYGDARTGIQQANNQFNQGVQQEGLIGNAYNAAFNTAIGAGAQDTANQLTAATTNANLNETALQRELSGATGLEGLQTQQLGTQTGANTLVAQNTAQQQAALTAQYNNWLQAQQSGLQGLAGANQTVAASIPATPSTSSTQQPNNSGYAMLGAAAPAIGMALLSDERTKDDIDEIGALIDGTPVFSYSYKNDPFHRKLIGLMAQDVKQRRPDAIVTLDDQQGTMMVDYGKATELSRALSALI